MSISRCGYYSYLCPQPCNKCSKNKYPDANRTHLYKCNLCGYTNTYIDYLNRPMARSCPIIGCIGTMRRVD